MDVRHDLAGIEASLNNTAALIKRDGWKEHYLGWIEGSRDKLRTIREQITPDDREED